MKVLILAGGYGTRLAAIAKNTAKPLLKVGNKSIIDHTLDHLEKLSPKEVIVVTNDKFFKDFERWAAVHPLAKRFKIRVVNDGTKTNEERLGSIGDINFVINNVNLDDDLLVVGGDNIFDFNIDAYVAVAQKRAGQVTVGVYDIKKKEEATIFGVLELNKDKKVVSFEEKPAQPKSSLISMCLYYLPKKTLGLIGDYLVQSGKSDRAGDYIIWLIKKAEVYGFEFSGRWFDIGSIESYNEAQQAYANK